MKTRAPKFLRPRKAEAKQTKPGAFQTDWFWRREAALLSLLLRRITDPKKFPLFSP